jgi:uncharacterized protein
MLKIKLSNLVNGRYDYEFIGKIKEIEISEPYIDNYKTKVVLNKFENQIILDVETDISAKLICDRCASDFQSIITSKYRMIYLFSHYADNTDNEKIDVVYLHPETDKIDLSKDVRDYALLALPMKKLCSEDCKGLCPKCGKNLNDGSCNCKDERIDERWEPLQNLKLKSKLN